MNVSERSLLGETSHEPSRSNAMRVWLFVLEMTIPQSNADFLPDTYMYFHPVVSILR